MSRSRALVVGAGMGGLAAALDLAVAGYEVEVFEQHAHPGGKMRPVTIGDHIIDAGPTVFTFKAVFDELFDCAETSLEAELPVEQAEVLARHGWTDGSQLDLFANIDDSAAAIEAFAGATEADGYRRFSLRAREIFETLETPFMRGSQPGSSIELVRRLGLAQLPALARTRPSAALWSALRDYFKDPRLRQLFGRYATYVGSSPLKAPATLMLIAHAEQAGVWRLAGGMHALARALVRVGQRWGVRYHFDSAVAAIEVNGGRASHVRLGNGERIEGDVVLFNGDPAALAAGLLGPGVRDATPAVPAKDRSLSALTWCTVSRPSGFELSHHNVFFAENYPEEFRAIFDRGGTVRQPTVYLCAQGRSMRCDAPAPSSNDGEPMLLLVNAPASGDTTDSIDEERVRRCGEAVLSACGLSLTGTVRETRVTGPAGFNALFPGSGGALYGRANHGAFGSFRRPGSRTVVSGLYLAGGACHPGAGVPMATLSGRLAAEAVLADREQAARSRGRR